MVTGIKERRLGIPRGDIERLMEHRGISAEEAEELLRTHSVEELLPQRGTGLLLGTAAVLASPNPVFLKENCYWPETIGVDEEFEGKLVVQNQGDAGQVWLGVRYEGVDYLMVLNGQESIPLDANQILEATYKGTMRDFLGEIEEFTESKTIELTFITGYLVDAQHILTDSWTARTYVKVGAAFPVPIWAIVVGVGAVGVGLVWVVTRK